ncbi:sulfite exporter TauE/SafE family protein [Exilibacterium tricleocarpae]|uniref:Sulfite exporter TauE/SafE family protein n=1 Tax=Exilibacterium tricleocarpae TaxID=2591008 RepID=A0A545U5J3_9GAMM|nr:sulfite exporter TauE/SafE family protein [Exilibacterium tricleocarpae]TQV84745.1 sulfite exporter TauE/SafE family protein [Exilibacterium tricleocarpae]
MPELGSYAAAFVLGLLGGAHCIGMCGGIMAALTFSLPSQATARRLWLVLCYNLGRIGSYGLMGVALGVLGGLAAGGHGGGVLRIVAGLLLIAMGLYLANWWRGLTYLERMGAALWRHIQPLGKRFTPVQSPLQALALGALWGWLPCGLVYSALAYAAVSANPIDAGIIMLAFGLGTLPAVFASGVLAERLQALLQRHRVRQLFALAIIGFGVWTLWAPLAHMGHTAAAAGDASHQHHH